MDNKKTITVVILGLATMAGILLSLFLPSESYLANIDFYVRDTSDNFCHEVNERLELLVNNTVVIRDKRLIWEMGNDGILMKNTNVSYTYRKADKYLVILKVDGKHFVNKYIKVVSGLKHEAIDSIPRINGMSKGYQGEELVFSTEGYGMGTQLREFGRSGTVDAYEQQVVYSCDIPGEYAISLQADTMEYPVKHRITILPRFEKTEELVTVDSLMLVRNDIREHLQAIVDTKISQKSVYYKHMSYICNKYLCIDADQVVAVVNGEKYNDFNGYYQGLHLLESDRKEHVSIDGVEIDDLNCVKSTHVTQSYIGK